MKKREGVGVQRGPETPPFLDQDIVITPAFKSHYVLTSRINNDLILYDVALMRSYKLNVLSPALF